MIPSSPPKATSSVPAIPSNHTGGANIDNTGTLKLLYSGSQNCTSDTQKDPDTSVDGSSQPQHQGASELPWSSVPAVANHPASAGLDALVAELESQERTNYFDESRRFGSPEKTQTPAKPIVPLAELTSAMRGAIPMGLTQLFNNTQDSPLQPTRTVEAITLPDPMAVTSPSRAPREKPSAQPHAPTKIPVPQEDVYYSIAESQEVRERRIGKGRKRRASSRPASSSDDKEINIILDDGVINQRTRKAAHAQRKNEEEATKVFDTMKASRGAKKYRVQATRKKRNIGSEQALGSIARESKETNDRADQRDDIGKKKKQTPSQKKAEERAQVIAEKRMRNRNISAPTGDDTTTDDEGSPPLPRNFPRQTSESQRTSKRSSNVQVMKPPNEAPSLTASAKPPEPFGPSDWESMHDIPRPPSARHGSFLRRKRGSIVSASDALANEVPSASTQLKTAKSSIKNMPPFNIPMVPPLLTERSTFPLIPFENISSSLPMPPAIGAYGLPATSGPPPLSLMGNATTTQVERSPPPGEHDLRGGIEVAASQPQLYTPHLRRTRGLDRAGTIPETSPIAGGSMITPVRCPPFSRVQIESTGVAETDIDSDKTPRVAPIKDTSTSKRKRDAMRSKPLAQESPGVSVVPSSLPREDQVPVTDREGDTAMGEARAAIGAELGVTRPLVNSLDTSYRKRRRTERPDTETQTPDHKENRKNSEFGPDNAGDVKSKTSTWTVKKSKVTSASSPKKAKPSHLTTSAMTADTLEDIVTPVTPVPGIDIQAPEAPENYAAHRVFALFRDKELHYHPATVLPSANVARSHLRVMFDDGTEVQTDRCHVRRLTLQVGDIIKYSEVSMKAKFWVVIGFPENQGPGLAAPEWESKLVDTNGHRTVLLKEKKKGTKLRTSTQNIPVADYVEDGTVGGSVEVPITKIYVVKSLWPQFKERLYGFEVGSPEVVDSPLSRLSVVPAEETPSSKDRRASPLFPSGANASKLLLSGIPVGANMKKVVDGVFSGMVFAISFGDNEFEKKGVIAKILANGGRILERGFDEMFKPATGAKSKPTAAPTTTSIASDTEKEGESVDGNCASGASGGDLSWDIQNGTDIVGFACVIADKYSRRVKFLQALALGIPCLAGRWVEDCIKKNMVVDWEMYLLPAGESAYLSGAIRSRILPSFSAATSKFLGIVEQRRRLLAGYNVLLVMGKGKVGEKRKPYRFLVWAMGARVVRGVVSMEEANAALREGVNGLVGAQDSGIDGVVGAELACQKWNFVYMDSGSGRVGREKLWTGVPKGWRPRIVDDEWVVQSLILGRLLDE